LVAKSTWRCVGGQALEVHGVGGTGDVADGLAGVLDQIGVSVADGDDLGLRLILPALVVHPTHETETDDPDSQHRRNPFHPDPAIPS
jgi:hypothetical protein